MPALWDHQERALEAVREGLRRGKRRVVVVLPTGGGKTRTACVAAAHHVAAGGKVLWIAHRDELCDQAYTTLHDAGLNVACIQAGVSGNKVNPHRPVQVASVQTLVARSLRPEATLVVADECHHFAADLWGKLLESYPTAIVLGLTATPERGDGRPLDFFDHLVAPTSVRELTKLNILVPCDVIGPKRSLGSKRIAQRPVDAWLAHAKGLKTICFAPHAVAAEEYLRDFLAAGVRAAYISHKSTDRREILDAYKREQIDVLINLQILVEGFDDRATQCCILARGCGHVGLYLQIVGRILRASPETGKTSALLLDLTGQAHVHGRPDEDREYSLEGEAIGRKGARIKERFCSVCGIPLGSAVAQVCVDCGIAKPELLAPEVTNDPLVKFAWIRKAHDTDKRKQNYMRWMDEAAAASQNPGRVYYKFKSVYGEDPDWSWKQEWQRNYVPEEPTDEDERLSDSTYPLGLQARRR